MPHSLNRSLARIVNLDGDGQQSFSTFIDAIAALESYADGSEEVGALIDTLIEGAQSDDTERVAAATELFAEFAQRRALGQE